jgi:hypothetical protein
VTSSESLGLSKLTMFSPKHLGLLLSAVPFLTSIASAAVTYIPPVVGNATSHVDYISKLHALDAPKVHNFNETTWDWWYFDAVDPNSNASAVVVFFATSQAGFAFVNPGMNFTLAMVWLTLANGTALPTVSVNADGACVTTESGRDGASGIWQGSGFSFESQLDMGRYTIKVDAPSAGVKGEMVFSSVCHPYSGSCSCSRTLMKTSAGHSCALSMLPEQTRREHGVDAYYWVGKRHAGRVHICSVHCQGQLVQ